MVIVAVTTSQTSPDGIPAGHSDGTREKERDKEHNATGNSSMAQIVYLRVPTTLSMPVGKSIVFNLRRCLRLGMDARTSGAKASIASIS